MKIQSAAMDHIVLNVSDVERSIAFYTQTLGLQGERLDEFRGGKVGFPSIRISAETLIDLFPAPEAAGEAKNMNHYCLVIEPVNLGALAESLKAQGVTVTLGPVPRWGARGTATSIYILDPDGNEIELRYYY
jgi:catechol 2,3-dioxygenase-like lactoylglutathione lyase family enzyme